MFGCNISRYIRALTAASEVTTRTGGASTELAAGATWQVSPAWSVYGELGQLWDSSGDARTKGGLNGSLGARLRC